MSMEVYDKMCMILEGMSRSEILEADRISNLWKFPIQFKEFKPYNWEDLPNSMQSSLEDKIENKYSNENFRTMRSLLKKMISTTDRYEYNQKRIEDSKPKMKYGVKVNFIVHHKDKAGLDFPDMMIYSVYETHKGAIIIVPDLDHLARLIDRDLSRLQVFIGYGQISLKEVEGGEDIDIFRDAETTLIVTDVIDSLYSIFEK